MKAPAYDVNIDALHSRTTIFQSTFAKGESKSLEDDVICEIDATKSAEEDAKLRREIVIHTTFAKIDIALNKSHVHKTT